VLARVELPFMEAAGAVAVREARAHG
jgi:hypothetical protein